MSLVQAAFTDLVETLDALDWLTVKTEPATSGARGYTIEVTGGTFLVERNFGCKTVNSGYVLTLVHNGQKEPSDLNYRLSLIDDAIVTDRRRGGNAQTTIFDEAGWAVVDDEGRSNFAIQTNLEIHIHEVN